MQSIFPGPQHKHFEYGGAPGGDQTNNPGGARLSHHIELHRLTVTFDQL